MGGHMSEVAELLHELKNRGVAVRAQGNELLIQDPNGKMTRALRGRLRTHKDDVIRQVVIDEIARCGINMNGPLSDEEFTSRYRILMDAWRCQVINDDTKDAGLDWLLCHWQEDRCARQ